MIFRGRRSSLVLFGVSGKTRTAGLAAGKLKEEEITSSVTQGHRVMHSPDSSSPKLEHMCERTQRPKREMGYSSSVLLRSHVN